MAVDVTNHHHTKQKSFHLKSGMINSHTFNVLEPEMAKLEVITIGNLTHKFHVFGTNGNKTILRADAK
jgi:hypothetical protein